MFQLFAGKGQSLGNSHGKSPPPTHPLSVCLSPSLMVLGLPVLQAPPSEESAERTADRHMAELKQQCSELEQQLETERRLRLEADTGRREAEERIASSSQSVEAEVGVAFFGLRVYHMVVASPLMLLHLYFEACKVTRGGGQCPRKPG